MAKTKTRIQEFREIILSNVDLKRLNDEGWYIKQVMSSLFQPEATPANGAWCQKVLCLVEKEV